MHSSLKISPTICRALISVLCAGTPAVSLLAQDTLHVAEDRVGIRTDSPEAALEVRDDQDASLWGTTFHSTQSSQFALRRALGTEASPAAPTSGQILGAFSFRGYNGSSFTGSKAFLAAAAEESWTPTRNGTRLFFSTTPVGSTQLMQRMTIKSSGNVGIGTTSPTSRLHVNGGDIRVTGGSFIDDGVILADYVFEPGYELMPIDELAEFISSHRHLPNVPNQEEVDREGLDLTEFATLLLEKIEELTLYTIAQGQEIDAIRSANEALRADLQALRAAAD